MGVRCRAQSAADRPALMPSTPANTSSRCRNESIAIDSLATMTGPATCARPRSCRTRHRLLWDPPVRRLLPQAPLERRDGVLVERDESAAVVVGGEAPLGLDGRDADPQLVDDLTRG